MHYIKKQDFNKCSQHSKCFEDFTIFIGRKENLDYVKVDSEAHRRADVDLLPRNKQEATIENMRREGIEVKYDDSKITNFCTETIANTTTNKPGWTTIIEANEIFWYYPNQNKLYIVNAQKLKDYVNSIYDEVATKTPNKLKYARTGNYYTQLLPIPIWKIRKLGMIRDEFNLSDIREDFLEFERLNPHFKQYLTFNH